MPTEAQLFYRDFQNALRSYRKAAPTGRTTARGGSSGAAAAPKTPKKNPTPPKPVYDQIMDVANTHTAARLQFGGGGKNQLLDAFTASMLKQVFEAVNADNLAKIKRMIETPAGLMKVVNIGWKHTQGSPRA